MRGLKGFLIVIIVVVLAVAGGGVVAFRSMRGKTSQPTEVKPGFLAVVNNFGIGLFAARVAPGPNVILFDTGVDQEGHPIDALLAALSAKRDDVTDVFLTHAHFDHVSGLPAVPKAKAHLGAADVPLAEGKASPDALVPKLLTLAMSTKPVTINAPIAGGAAATFPVGPANAKDGEKPAQKTVKAIPVPGHTPGSYAYLYDGVLVAGDIMVFKQGRLDPTPGLFDAHPDQTKAAIRSLKSALANDTIDVVCTAHGGCTPSGLGKNLLDELISRL